MNAVVRREPRAMTIEPKIIVRNVQAADFDEAKEVAREFAKEWLSGKGLYAYAGRDLDGSYTVEFR